MHSQTYRTLPKEAAAIRQEVLMEEQGFTEEFDQTDETALHLVLWDGAQPVAVCRTFPSEERGSWVIGRVAVRKPFRKRGLGAQMVQAAEDAVRQAGGTRIELAAQEQAAGFYRTLGYAPLEERFLDEGCPHVWMRKEL